MPPVRPVIELFCVCFIAVPIRNVLRSNGTLGAPVHLKFFVMFFVAHAKHGIEEGLADIRGVHHHRIRAAHDQLIGAGNTLDFLSGQQIPAGEVIAGRGLTAGGGRQAGRLDCVLTQLLSNFLNGISIFGVKIDPCFTVGGASVK